MRTQKFQKVFDRVVRLLGRDPLAELPQDTERAIIDHINERVDTIWSAWDWPEWQLTEERAFRQIWTATDEYKRESDADGEPEEVYYLTDETYYRVLADAPSDPPVGTLPTDETYWEAIEEPIDAYIDYDQRCRRAIGRVMGVYNSNPRNNGCAGGLCFHPSEKGIDVRGSGNPTVFVRHMMPRPEYSMQRFIEGRTYVRADVVFDPDTGECFQAVATTTDAPGTADWRWVPFLEKWATYVVQGAFSDCLTEFDQGGNDDLQAKLALASAAADRAMNALQMKIDEQAAQGQKVYWGFCKNRNIYWYESVPFTGGAVSTLTAECEDELGWVFPTPSPTPPAEQGLLYFPLVVSLKTDAPTLVDTVATVNFADSVMAVISTGQHFRLDPGPANDLDPGEGDPADYILSTNNRHWVEVI